MDFSTSVIMTGLIGMFILDGLISYILRHKTSLPGEKAAGLATVISLCLFFLYYKSLTTGFRDTPTNLFLIFIIVFSYFVRKGHTRPYYQKKREELDKQVLKNSKRR